MKRIDRLLLCSCAGSQSIDEASAKAATGAAEVQRIDALCEGEIDVAAAALGLNGVTVLACAQQAALFADLAEEIGAPGTHLCVDIRDRAGWTDDATAHAKQAALLAEARLSTPSTPVRDVTSEGVALVVGGEAALAAAHRLAETLAVTLILADVPELLSPSGAFDVARGRIRAASGTLGGFQVTVDGFAPLDPKGRGGPRFAPAVDGATSRCDIILDLRPGGAPLFPAHHKRDGYVRADPGDPAAVERAIFDAGQLVGDFEKPLYIRFDPLICAHSRAGQPGCTRCLGVCPTAAITPAGDTVAIDAMVCAGCGACAAVCPSGAASYDDPPAEHLFIRLSTLASAFRNAGGTGPCALFHDTEHGAEMIALSARFGRGLPANVVPVEVSNVEGVGHAELLAALGVGFASAIILAGPRTDLTVPDRELNLAQAILGGVGRESERLAIIAPDDPDALEDELYGTGSTPLDADPILALGSRRQVTRLAASALSAVDKVPPIPLPEGAPYGAIAINDTACTLCLACVSLCPVGALGDNPDKPQVNFQEAACLQCGICANACPEDAITLAPGLDLSNDALTFRVLNEEEPFECIECGKPFGVRSTIERIVATLEGKHWMFTNSDNVRLIKMCDDCRVRAQYHGENSPFKVGARPRVRRTEDDLAERDKLN